MNWKKLKIYCTPEAVEILSAVLLDNGITGFIINDPNTIDEIYNAEHSHWAYIDDNLEDYKSIDTSVEIYFPEDQQGRESLLNVQSAVNSLKTQDFGFDLGSLEFEYDEADDKLWLNDWKKYFKPIKIGETFYIKPSWETIDEKHDRYVIEMDPANSFGSGTHATTQLCLEAFEKIYDKSKNITVLDLGCGSGILGIGAALSGVKNITFADIDLHCTQTAKENAINNNLNIDNLRFVCGNILTNNNLIEEIGTKKYDIVFANIMAEILIEMSPVLEKFLKEKGYIILSGIITQRLEAVKAAFTNEGYDIISVDIKDDWCAVVVQK
ncbi:MAG: 50S ribosomal protein L11 methyltransferase [Clostridia bacterium]|nr:50S ribosomal protein L11 methyltransferase [Clostridia bacterium]